MKSLIDLVNQIRRNRFVWKLCISLVVLLPLATLMVIAEKLGMGVWVYRSTSAIFALVSIYILFSFYRVLYDLTSVNQYKTDISLFSFIWLTLKYQIIFGLIIVLLFLPILYLFNYSGFGVAESAEKIGGISSVYDSPIFIIFRQIAEFFFLMGFVIVVGSRALDSISAKLKILFFNKSTIIIMSIVVALNILIELGKPLISPKPSGPPSLVYNLILMTVYVGYILSILALIREWQKLYFQSISN
ncbi:hypothetical protein EHO59_06215 [Leptospira semungkisensis]|uniref:Uncharacterized protein n=1 Tax=Leptospira semungkisensis TaxID=2484985 RepID=A0A4R9G7U1_9LEPT|nr:hypothetical protein [Leptospira semungkisensis]TGK07692.1 hypothetical protein EHO59_06215 [Leptospira semungkisensis]